MPDTEKHVRSELQKQELAESIRDLFEQRITFNQQIGLKIEKLEPGPVCLHFSMKKDLVGHYLYGRLHGGVIASAIDVAGGLAVLKSITDFYSEEPPDKVMQRFKGISTIDLRIDYLRPGLGEYFTVEADIVKSGKRVAFTKMLLKNEQDKDIAMGSGTYTSS